MRKLRDPYQAREVFARAMEWKPSSDSLPMSLSVKPGAVAYTAGFLLMAMLSIGLPGDVALVAPGVSEPFVGSILLGLLLFAVCAYFLYATLAKVRTTETLPINTDEVSLESKAPFKSEAWQEPLSNYPDIAYTLIKARPGERLRAGT